MKKIAKYFCWYITEKKFWTLQLNHFHKTIALFLFVFLTKVAVPESTSNLTKQQGLKLTRCALSIEYVPIHSWVTTPAKPQRIMHFILWTITLLRQGSFDAYMSDHPRLPTFGHWLSHCHFRQKDKKNCINWEASSWEVRASVLSAGYSKNLFEQVK